MIVASKAITGLHKHPGTLLDVLETLKKNFYKNNWEVCRHETRCVWSVQPINFHGLPKFTYPQNTKPNASNQCTLQNCIHIT